MCQAQDYRRFANLFLLHPFDAKHDISEILAWSFRHCVLGTWPAHRHDGTPWTAEDRRNRRGYPGRHVPRIVTARGTLSEVRMDWKYYVSLFGFPAHNYMASNCWRCTHTPHQAMEVGAAAHWRSSPLTHGGALATIRARGKRINALLQLPFFSVPHCCRMDWLHVADQGVAADLAGNFSGTFSAPLLAGRLHSGWLR